MKTKLLLAVYFVFTLSACNTATTPDKSTTVYSVDEFLEVINDKVGDTITIEGLATDMCQTGDWVVLQGDDTLKMIQVVASPELTSFSKDMMYNDLVVKGVLNERRIDSVFLVDWESRLDQSLKDGNPNTEAIAQLKGQIAQIWEAIAENKEKHGRNYWSQFTIAATEYEAKQ